MPKMQKLQQETVGGEPYHYYSLGKYIVRAPGVCGGRPTFKYTRIEMTFILNLLASGETIDELVADYEGRVTREAILEAIQLAADRFNQTLPAMEMAQ